MERDKLKNVEITYFLVPFLIITIVFSALVGLTVKNRVDDKSAQLKDMTLEIANSYSHNLAHTDEAFDIIVELLDEKIRIASQAIMLIENKENNETLDTISESFNVDEIHLYNSEGEITHSTNEDFIGWKAYEGHPVYGFMMSDQTTLVEEVRRDTENGLHYKFGYVKNDNGGFVQLGVLAENIQNFLDDFEVTKLVNELSSIGDIKHVLVLNTENEIIASSLPENPGSTLENNEFLVGIEDNESEVQRQEIDGYNFFRVSVPIISENEKLGTLVLHWPTDKLDAEIGKIIRFGIIVFIIIILILGSILYYAYRKNKSNIQIAYYDEYTGLRNNKYLSDYLEKVLRNPRKRNKAIFLLNFKSFKTLEMTYGFSYGNEILKKIANKIRKTLDSDEVLFRIDGNRFVVVLDNYDDQKELNRLVEKLIRSFEIPIKQGPELQYADVQVAIVEIQDRHTSPDKVLQEAILTLSHIKDSLVNQVAFFNEDMQKSLQRQDKIIRVLRKVIDGEDTESFYLEFQPMLDLTKNKIIGFEALARLRIEKLGQIGPDEFIALAEEKLLINELGNHIILLACEFLKKIQDEGFNEITVAVNISGIQLLREDFVKNLHQNLLLSDKVRNSMEFEITESVLLDHYSQVNETLEEIKKMGIAISLDDFGTGFSSFSRLAELNIDTVKIDRFFIDTISHTAEKDLIISDIISMVHKMGLNVVAEGVELEQQKMYLQKYGCDIMQGYLLSRPLSEASALDFLRGYEG